ncbi:MAG: nucleoside hydrolase [Rhodospirillaceae bacterium]|nr:MAG: nucleoside hydrolase [Rhodospirillaceae bacterium]
MAMHRIIIDTDPGIDDAAAILLAMISPEIEILGMTTVAGNVPLALTTTNALKLCELGGRTDIKVYAGADRPLVRDAATAEHVHGTTGMDGAILPVPTKRAETQHGIDWLVETLLAAEPESITLIVLGPQTNIALALRRAPQIREALREVVIMGGASEQEGGNITPFAEFNIYVDPEAAAEVFDAKLPVTLVSLDVARKVVGTVERLDRLRHNGNAASVALADMLGFYTGRGNGNEPMYDPLTIAWLLQPDFFTSRMAHIAVDTGNIETAGQTRMTFDAAGSTNRVLLDCDAAGFFELLTTRVARIRGKRDV